MHHNWGEIFHGLRNSRDPIGFYLKSSKTIAIVVGAGYNQKI
jgi:hypothetical protein